MIQPYHPRDGGAFYWTSMDQRDGIQSPMESFSSFDGEVESSTGSFSQNPKQFFDRIGLIVGLQGNGKVNQEESYEQIKALWSQRKGSCRNLID